ncbi:MAG: class I SAM-dependent methyltransferase [Gammaproteobacteria bacterium]|nr:class I SAM-dependent methyltransferase [Gammaproteobacteria bacterium]
MNPELKQSVMGKVQGALMLNIAYIGITNGLLDKLAELNGASAAELANAAKVDEAYTVRWCDSAYAFELLDEDNGKFVLTETGNAFRPDVADSLMPFAVHSVLSTHMADRAAELMASGERPGEVVLGERKMVLPWFGPMLASMFGPFLEQHILPNVPAYEDVDGRQGLAVDLGCGNGWYLRKMAQKFPHMRCIGLDGFDENINQATAAAKKDGVADRVSFQVGDIHKFNIDEPVDLIAMNRALHHVWDQKENVFRILSEHLRPGGYAVIWEPNWPADRSALRDPGRRAMAFQNLGEHIQGNHFLNPPEVVAAFESVGMEAEVFLFGDDKEMVIVGKKV